MIIKKKSKTNNLDIYADTENMDDFEIMNYYRFLNENEKNYYRNEKPKVQKEIFEFRKGIDSESIRISRLEWLSGILPPLAKEIDELENMKKRHGKDFLLDDELKKIKNQYKRYYLEYGTVKQGVPENGKHDDVIIENARNAPIENLIEGRVFDAGNNRKRSLCPFHEEKTGSFFIFENNSYHCFGCQKHGNNAIDFIMDIKNMNFRDAVEYLKAFL